MAPGSEHLQQTRKSLAVVNGRQGRQQEASSFCPFVRSCSRHQTTAARTQAHCRVPGATGLGFLCSRARPPPATSCGLQPQVRRVCSAFYKYRHQHRERSVGEVALQSPLSGVMQTRGGTKWARAPQLKTVMTNSLQSNHICTAVSEGTAQPDPGGDAQGHLGGAARPWRRHVDMEWDTMYTFTGLGTGQGERQDVETGAVATWKILYSGDREKGTRTMTPNHADRTAGAAQQNRGSRQQVGLQEGGTQILQGWPRGALPSQLLLAWGRQSRWRKEAQGPSIKITWHHASPGSTLSEANLSRTSSIFQVGSRTWQKGLRAVLPHRQGRPKVPASPDTQTEQEGRTQRSLG